MKRANGTGGIDNTKNGMNLPREATFQCITIAPLHNTPLKTITIMMKDTVSCLRKRKKHEGTPG